jgi:hypothetical protein
MPGIYEALALIPSTSKRKKEEEPAFTLRAWP